MTLEEAIEELKDRYLGMSAYANREQCEKANKALDIAITALEKQIPKKPKVLKVQEVSGYKYGGCECGKHIMDDEKYCSNCGQALDWSDTNGQT